MRVQIPAYSDQWMKGDRYGEIVNRVISNDPFGDEVVYVKLDKSGKTYRYKAFDCVELD